MMKLKLTYLCIAETVPKSKFNYGSPLSIYKAANSSTAKEYSCILPLQKTGSIISLTQKSKSPVL